MGDYTKNGAKIGTCGVGYYATKKMLEDLKAKNQEGEGRYYLEPKNGSSFAFPFPEFDGKKAGDISVFHKEEKDHFQIRVKREGSQTHHKDLVFHKHPVGGQGLNFFCKCPYHSEENVSKNFSEEYVKFHLKYQQYFQNELAIAGDCIYCGCNNVFEKHEAEEAASYLIIEADFIDAKENASPYEKEQAELKREVAKRIIETYA